MYVGPAYRIWLTGSAEVIDKWFEDLQNYEATLEEMAAASLDQNFKEELSAIEQCMLDVSISVADHTRVPRALRGLSLIHI